MNDIISQREMPPDDEPDHQLRDEDRAGIIGRLAKGRSLWRHQRPIDLTISSP
jgi:hypothetical protein